MHTLSKEDFLRKKRRGTLAIMGCGYSINDITAEQWDYISFNLDTFGMNWYLNAGRDTTWYLVREQCITQKRLEPGSMLSDLYEKINKISTTLIVKDLSCNENNFQHAQNTEFFLGEGTIFKEIPGKCGVKAFKHDIFEDGIHHGRCTLYDALHFATYMRYNKIVFFGIDLYDTRYFWLREDETRDIVRMEGSVCTNPHPTLGKTLKLIESFKNVYPEIEMFVHNPKSELARLIPVWSI